MDNLTPAQMQQLRMMLYQGGAPGGTPGAFGGAFGATAPSANVGASYGSPITIDHMGEDAGMPSQLQGYSLFNPADWNTQYNRFMPGTSYGHYGPDGSFMGMDKTQTDGPDGIQSLVLAGILAMAGGAGYSELAGGGAAADGAGGMALQEGAYPASLSGGAEAGAGSTAAMGAGGAVDPALGGGGSDIFGGSGMATGFTDTGTAGGALDAGYAGAGAATGAGGLAGPALGSAGGSAGGAAGGATGGAGSTSGLGGLGSMFGGNGGLLSAGAGLASSLIGASAAKNAANAQVTAGNNSIALQRDIYNSQLGLQAPYREAGLGAMSKLSSLLGTGGDPSAAGYGSLTHNFGMPDFQMDPGIQFQKEQGNLALQNSQAAKDGVLSGAAMKALIGYNQGMAGLGYQSAYDRYMNNNAATYSRLMGVTGIGQAAASNSAANAGAFGQSAGNTMVGIGNAQAGGDVGAANAITGGINNVGNLYLLRSLLKPNSSTPTDSSTGA